MKYYDKVATVLILQMALLHTHVFGAVFIESFETPTQQAPAAWQVQAGSATVVSGQTGAVGTSLKLATTLPGQAETRVVRPITGWNQSEPVAFIDFLIKPAANPEGSMASVYVNGTQIAFQVPSGSTQGQIWAYHGNDDDTTGASEQWLKSPASYTISTSTQQATAFSRLTLRHDYQHKIWDLFVDGKLAAANLGFDGRETNLTSIEFYGSDVADLHLDQLQADPSNLLFPDADKDGLPDAWETANGSNPNLYDRDTIKPGTGKSFLENYAASLWTATVPNGANGGAASSASIPPLTVLGAHQAVGSLKGSLAVGGDGSATYSIPIDIPKGTAGMEPKLSLNYSSSGGSGMYGVGWSLGGLQKITRGPASAAKDGNYDPVDFDEYDRYFLDGERLICIAGTYGSPGSEYRTEMDAYSRITLNGTAPANYWWKLETKAGLIVELGNTTDSREAAVGENGILSWSVNKVKDTCDNYYAVQYANEATEGCGYSSVNRCVSRVDYTGGVGRAPYCSVVFDYETRPDQGRAFTPYAGYLVTKRLSKIWVQTANEPPNTSYYTNHSYRLSYQNSWQSGRSFLTSIQKFVNDNNALGIPASTFTYDGLAQGQPIWQDNGASKWPLYGSGWDASGSVNSLVTLGTTNDEVRLNGDVSRGWVLPSGVTLYPDTKLTFKFKAENFVSGAYIGFDTNTASSDDVFMPRLCLIRGSGSPPSNSIVPRAREISYAPDASGWQTITFDVGAIPSWQTSLFNVGAVTPAIQSHLALINVDETSADGISTAIFKDIRIYRSGTQQPGDVAPLAFTAQGELPDLLQGSDDRGIRFIDLDDDGLAELCDWRATQYVENWRSLSGLISAVYDVKPSTVGTIYRNLGGVFTADASLAPPAALPLSCRESDKSPRLYDWMHHLFARPIDINGDGRTDLIASEDIRSLRKSGNQWFSNGISFYTRVNGVWREMPEYKLPFRIGNVPNGGTEYGGWERDHHYEWVDLDADGYTDLLLHTTAIGQLLSLDESQVLAGGNKTTAWLNKVHLGQGWVRRDELGLPERLKTTYAGPEDEGRRLMDLNGDGRIEMVESLVDGSNNTRHTYFLSAAPNGALTGWNSTFAQRNPPVSPWDLPAHPSAFELNAPFVTTSGVPRSTQLIDLNGDGLPDIERSVADGVAKIGTWLNHGAALGRWVAEPKVGNGVTQEATYYSPRLLNCEKDGSHIPFGYEWADLNGDGLVDLFYSNFGTPSIDNVAVLNSGSGWISRPEWGAPGSARIYLSVEDRLNSRRRLKLQDLNGDGFPDLITGLINDTQKVWLNQCKKEVLTSVTDGFGTTLGIEYKRLNDPTAVAGGTSRVFQPYTGTLPTGQAVSCGPQLVVSRLLQPDGLGGQTVERHYYGDLRSDRLNESSLGFGWTEVYKDLYPAGGGVIPRGYSRCETSRTYPFGGSVVKSESFVYVGQADSRLPGVTTGYKRVSLETSTYGELATTAGIGGTVRRPVQTGSVSERYDLDGTLMARTTATQALADFDAYGFVKASTVTALDDSSTATTSTYAHNTVGKWHLGRLQSSTVVKTAPGKASSTKSTAFTYDSTTGLLETEVIQPGHPQAVTTTYSHDASGNVLSKTVSTADGSRSAETNYDADGRFAVSETTVGLGSTTTAYDLQRALVTSATDLDGLVTTFDYDAYGTQIAINKADGTRAGEITRYASNASLPGPVASQLGNQTIRWAKTAQSSGSPWASVYYDAFGREVAKETSILTGFNGTASVWRDVYVVTQYDQRGRKVKASQPFFAGETPLWTTIGYDPVDRPMVTTYPDGASDAVVFHNRTTLSGQPVAWSKISNRNGQMLERWEDQHGRMVQSKDPSSQVTTFTHDVEGRLLQVQIDGTTLLTNEWDVFGRKTGVTDIDAGASSSAYNAFGEVVSTTNALGQTTTTDYDSLGRAASVTKPEGIYTTTYRTTSPAKGKPAFIAGPNGYSESFGYDTYGRVTSTSTTRFGETFTTQTTYDALGRVSSETDAGGLTLIHDYDTVFSAKIRTREAGTNTTLWEPRLVDSQGRVIQQKLAHGVDTIRTPNPANGTLTSIYSTGQGKVLQNLAYTWDPNGSLTFRADSLAGRNETFGYDTLNRLTSAAVAGQSAANYTYAPNGNLLTKAGDTLTYSGSRIHAVSTATIKGESRTYAYDAVGRVTSDTARTYGWTSFHQLAWVSQLSCPRLKSFDPLDAASSGIPGIAQAVQYLPSQGVTQFDFDAAGSRARQFLVRTFADTSTADVTTLYLGSYEREIHRTTAAGSSTPVVQKTLHRHNLGGAIYTVEQTAGNSPVHKLATLLTDHLGSTDVMLIGTWNGSAWSNFQSERQSFNPWGERRNANTWAALRSGSGDDRQTSGAHYKRGFTGHEMLDDFGLIHMNGRIYDPELGRFLSADPYVQIPEYSQNFNRYSYVLNNPLTFTDPSGHRISGIWAAVAMVVVAIVAWYVAPIILGAFGASTAAGGLAATGTSASLASMAAQGAVAGAISGGASAAISGGSGSDILKGAFVGAVQGAICGGVLHGLADGKGFDNPFLHVAGHGLVGGAANKAMGGRFQDGFISGAVSTGAVDSGFVNGGIISRTIKVAIVGGTASALGGGKFANGAFTAAFQFLANGCADYVRDFTCGFCSGVADYSWKDCGEDWAFFGRQLAGGVGMCLDLANGALGLVDTNLEEAALVMGPLGGGVEASLAEVASYSRVAMSTEELALAGNASSKAGAVSNTAAGAIKVIGRLDDTANYAYKRGFEVIEAENWSVPKNFQWMDEGIKNSQIFKLASPRSWSNLYRPSGPYMGPTMYGRELQQLIEAGYTRIGSYMHPPKL